MGVSESTFRTVLIDKGPAAGRRRCRCLTTVAIAVRGARSPTLDDELDDVRRLSDDIGEGARVGAAVLSAQPAQLHTTAVHADAVVGGRPQLAPVLAPRQRRRRRRGRLAEHVDRVALLLDEERRRDFAQHRRSCSTTHAHRHHADTLLTYLFIYIAQNIHRIVVLFFSSSQTAATLLVYRS